MTEVYLLLQSPSVLTSLTISMQRYEYQMIQMINNKIINANGKLLKTHDIYK